MGESDKSLFHCIKKRKHVAMMDRAEVIVYVDIGGILCLCALLLKHLNHIIIICNLMR